MVAFTRTKILVTPPPLKRRDRRSAGYTCGTAVNIQAVSFPGYTGEIIFQVRHGESLKQVYCFRWMVGFKPTARKNHVQPATPFVDRSSRGVAVRLTACKKLTNLVAYPNLAFRVRLSDEHRS